MCESTSLIYQNMSVGCSTVPKGRLLRFHRAKSLRQGRLGFYAPVSGQEASMIGTHFALHKALTNSFNK